jgi:hypothetical protein
MKGTIRMKCTQILAVVLCVALVSLSLPATAQNAEVRVTIMRVKNIQGGDVLSKPDYFAKVTIAEETFTSQHIQDKDDISPNWIFTKSAPIGFTGQIPIVIAIFDKDVTKDDPVDVSPAPDRRELRMNVNAIACTIAGDVTARCGTAIVTAGNVSVKPRAELTFTVEVRKP